MKATDARMKQEKDRTIFSLRRGKNFIPTYIVIGRKVGSRKRWASIWDLDAQDHSDTEFVFSSRAEAERATQNWIALR